MKNIKKLLGVFVFITSTLFMPNIVNAESDMFSKFPTYEKNGKTYLDIKAINPMDTPTEFCKNVYGDDEESQNACKNDYIQRYMHIVLKDVLGEDNNTYSYQISEDNVKITYCPNDYQSVNECQEKQYNIIWEEYKNKDEVVKLSKEIKDTYTVYGETHINMAYHIDNFSYYDYLHGNMKKGNYDLVLSYYPEFKEIIEEYTDYEFVLISAPSGGIPLQLNGGALVGIFKDGVLLNAEYVDFRIHSILFVPLDNSNDLIKSAENLLKKSFKKNKTIEITKNSDFDDEITDSDWQEILKEDINVDEYLQDTEDKKYNYELVSVKVGNSVIKNNFMILEIPKEKYKELVVKSKDKNTGVNIISKGLDVPIDVKIRVEDLKNNKAINNNGIKNNIKFEEIFDISLIRRYDGTFIEQTPSGVEVYIPVSNYKEDDKLDVYYIKDEVVQDEKIESTVVEVDDKLYAKFIANHFSTYAIGKDISENNIDVPNTFDGITNSILLGMISFIGLIGTVIYLKKEVN